MEENKEGYFSAFYRFPEKDLCTKKRAQNKYRKCEEINLPGFRNLAGLSFGSYLRLSTFAWTAALVINPSFLRMQESREPGNGFPPSRE
jgi:hypothetical protein